jgi:hypothetical protein
MLSLQNEKLGLVIGDDGHDVVVRDRFRKCTWRLNPDRQYICRPVPAGQPSNPEPVPCGTIDRIGNTITTVHALPEGRIRFIWSLGPDYVRVELDAVPAAIDSVSLPGSFLPDSGRAEMLIASCQGGWYRPCGERWEDLLQPGSTYTLAMAAMMGRKGGLMVTMETPADWQCRYGEGLDGAYFVMEPSRCEAAGWYRREVRLYPVDRDITGIAKRYRQRVKERGEFVSWNEKIARKPILENLFGSLMAFIGYNKAPEIDYVGSARKLHAWGFESVLYYPVRMCNYSLGFRMGGDPPIWFSDEEIRQLKSVPGALVAPWGWYVEGIDDGAERMHGMYRRRLDGGFYDGWKIDKFQWKSVCTPYQVEESRRRFQGDMAAMDWIHYDVNATCGLRHPICHSREHALHGGTPMARAADMEWTRQLLGPETNENRIVSSEGFIDRFTTSYDIGTVKSWPACAPNPWIPVPLTMLVFHDSTVHDWWELHNYNQVPGFPAATGNAFRTFGSGGAAKKAAMDALYGCPPNVFPFGRQYAWVDVESRRTFSVSICLEDREVQRALAAALPVTRLHRKIGKLELVSFEFLTDDCAVQSSVFSDGTRVVANIHDFERRTERYGVIPANSWREMKE